MSDENLSLDKRLMLVSFAKDPEPFIVVDTDKCDSCKMKPCLHVCPAEVYTWRKNYSTTRKAAWKLELV